MLYRAGWSNLDDDDLVDDFSIVPSPGESTPNNTPSVEPDSVESTATDENNKIENNSENE